MIKSPRSITWMVPFPDQRKLLGRWPVKSAGRENITWNSGASARCCRNFGSGSCEDRPGVAIICPPIWTDRRLRAILSQLPDPSLARSSLNPNMFGEEVNKRAYARRQGAATPEEHGVDAFPVARVEFLEHRHEPAGLDIRIDMKSR